MYFTYVQTRCKVNTRQSRPCCCSKDIDAVGFLINLCWRDAACLETSAPFSLSSLAVDQLYSSVSRLGGLKFFTPEFGWARAKRGTRWPSSWHTDEVVLGNLKAQTKTTMTSTNMFQGLDTGSKPSSR